MLTIGKMREENSFLLCFCYSYNEIDGKADLRIRNDGYTWLVSRFAPFIISICQVASIQKEIELVLHKLGVKHDAIFFKHYGREELKLSIKNYYISWSTLKELVTYCISEALELGLAKEDISYGLLTRNFHFKESNFPKIFKAHEKNIEFSEARKIRNKIIHEGTLIDKDLERLDSEYGSLNAQISPLFSVTIA